MLSSEGESPSGSDGKKELQGEKRASSNPVPKSIDNKKEKSGASTKCITEISVTNK